MKRKHSLIVIQVVVEIGSLQGEDELRSNAFRGDDIDIFIMRTDDFLHDGQAQACPLFYLYLWTDRSCRNG